MEVSNQILSDITVHMKYARYLPELKRRETWEELVTRNKNMHQKKYPHLKEQIEDVYQYVYRREVLPSMRSLQFGGKPIEISPNRIFNCAYMPFDDWRGFSELMFLLLGGTGVGYSVQYHHIDGLPEIRKPRRTRRFLVSDSIEGWADAVKVLMKSYFFGTSEPVFDFSDIRPKGSLLVTSGGKAPGPQPLKDCLHNIRAIMDTKDEGEKLTSLEVHDIACHIADAVLSGGIRRAAMISLFSFDDEAMKTCKFGKWFELNPQRARANNTAVTVRHRVSEEDFFGLMSKVEASGSGEPGVFFTNDHDMGINPCSEISLRPFQFCNLTEVNGSAVQTQQQFNEFARAAAFIGTLQAGYTDFHYLRDIWRRNTEKDALIGVGITGIVDGKVLDLNMTEAAHQVKEENRRVAGEIGINQAARTTTVKPSGTSSLVLGCASGIHARYAEYYIRRLRVGKNESIYDYLLQTHPQLLEDDFLKPTLDAVISVAQKSPEGAVTRHESPLQLLERVKRVNMEWVRAGHRKGNNYNNVSATVSVKDDEWSEVFRWMWENRDTFTGLSLLPFSNHTYVQTPFEEITQAEYEKLMKPLGTVNIDHVHEDEDNTNTIEQVACGGGACELEL